MNTEVNEVTINGVKYLREGQASEPAEKLDGMKYVIIRTYSAGVFAGYLEKREGKEAVMRKARRLWYWSGAASLSQLAMEGTKKQSECKFPCEVERIELTEAIEILEVTKQAQENIKAVPVWKQ